MYIDIECCNRLIACHIFFIQQWAKKILIRASFSSEVLVRLNLFLFLLSFFPRSLSLLGMSSFVQFGPMWKSRTSFENLYKNRTRRIQHNKWNNPLIPSPSLTLSPFDTHTSIVATRTLLKNIIYMHHHPSHSIINILLFISVGNPQLKRIQSLPSLSCSWKIYLLSWPNVYCIWCS